MSYDDYNFDKVNNFIDGIKYVEREISRYVIFTMMTTGFGLILIATILYFAK